MEAGVRNHGMPAKEGWRRQPGRTDPQDCPGRYRPGRRCPGNALHKDLEDRAGGTPVRATASIRGIGAGRGHARTDPGEPGLLAHPREECDDGVRAGRERHRSIRTPGSPPYSRGGEVSGETT